MDVLSDVIAVMRTGQPRSARVAWQAPWAQQFASVPGSAGFQVILQGPCWLIRPDAEPVPLAAGDVVPVLRYYASDTVGVPTGTDVPATVTLCGGYQLDSSRAHPLLNDLPELIHLPAHLGRHPELRATVDLLASELERPRLGTAAIVPALLDTLLLHILRAWLDRQPARGTTTGWAAALNDPPTTAALRAMHRDPARPWTVARSNANTAPPPADTVARGSGGEPRRVGAVASVVWCCSLPAAHIRGSGLQQHLGGDGYSGLPVRGRRRAKG